MYQLQKTSCQIDITLFIDIITSPLSCKK